MYHFYVLTLTHVTSYATHYSIIYLHSKSEQKVSDWWHDNKTFIEWTKSWKIGLELCRQICTYGGDFGYFMKETNMRWRK